MEKLEGQFKFNTTLYSKSYDYVPLPLPSRYCFGLTLPKVTQRDLNVTDRYIPLLTVTEFYRYPRTKISIDISRYVANLGYIVIYQKKMSSNLHIMIYQKNISEKIVN